MKAKHFLAIPFALALLFAALKIFGAITWRWLWVLSPVWIPFALFLLAAFGVFVWIWQDMMRHPDNYKVEQTDYD